MKMLTPIADALGALSERMGLEGSIAVYRLQRHWKEVVGPQIAAHTHPMLIRRGVLHLRVDHPTWNHQITFFKEDIIKKSNAFLSAEVIHRARTEIGPLPTVAPYTTPSPTQAKYPAIPQEANARLEKLLLPLSDEELKETIRQAMRRHWASA